MIRVRGAAAHAAVRAGFAAPTAAHDERQVAGEAADGREAVDLARRLLPQIVLMDIRMPRLDGLEATRLICGDATLTEARVPRADNLRPRRVRLRGPARRRQRLPAQGRWPRRTAAGDPGHRGR